ncbi:hypothetical protein RhiXN_08411 [Rhizoctonia solani]|uniref:Uncharacterized protein n=1 Tax=Rhizoctonia solani TaxID=456999 RepID=A0A8H8P1I8_9AGAM|nr:uncharacterized protein RhiXN_08411 [Rhizoctonia solani]QRW23375.1 hypothetical protein RhiXN_08411 [Rhizoctonia solani]
MAEPGSTSFSEDWDRTTPAPSTPPSNSRLLPDGTPGGSRSLSDLMRLHAEHGKENLQLNPQEEQRLEEELARWVNSEEDDETYFGRRSLDDASARPRGTVDLADREDRARATSMARTPENEKIRPKC